MNLYIIRHAIAVEPGTPGYKDDSQRPLTERGSERMVNIARGLKALDVRFDLILSSPHVRATETARILVKVLKMDKTQMVLSENLEPMGFADQLIGEINEKYSNLDSIAVVGHEPNLSSLISLLVAGDPALSINMKKGGVCHLTADNLLHERRATLEWLMMPKHLIGLGERE
jgi:phosphohistidine phosphatase